MPETSLGKNQNANLDVSEEFTESRIVLSSQSANPDKVRLLLLKSAFDEAWIALVVNMNMAIFIGLILLALGHSWRDCLIFLIVQLSTTTIAIILVFYFQVRKLGSPAASETMFRRLVTLMELLIMSGWGFSAVLFYSIDSIGNSFVIVLLLMVIGVSVGALNSKFLKALVAGRVALFAPSILYLVLERPEWWGLLVLSITFAFAVSIGIGYALFVQHLREANLSILLSQARNEIRGQSEALERSMISELEARNRSLEEGRLRERFLHSVSHDLRQPINALVLYVKELQFQNLGRKAKPAIEACVQCLSSANAIIDSVSQIGWIKDRLPPPKIEIVALQTVFDTVETEMRLSAIDKGLTLEFTQTHATVQADRYYMERALRNLVHNAIQYTDSGGITVGVENGLEEHVDIAVSDTGIGIAPEEQKNIFKPFYQTKGASSRTSNHVGLGLSIVHDLAEVMGGAVFLDSQVGKGSTFRIRLKRANPKTGINKPTVVESDAAFPSMDERPTLLIVEDDQHSLEHIRDMFAGDTVSVTAVCHHDDMIALTPDRLKTYNHLILDYNLAPDLNALDLLRACDQEIKKRCLVISTEDSPPMLMQLIAEEIAFLKKPFDSETLKQRLKWIEEAVS